MKGEPSRVGVVPFPGVQRKRSVPAHVSPDDSHLQARTRAFTTKCTLPTPGSPSSGLPTRGILAQQPELAETWGVSLHTGLQSSFFVPNTIPLSCSYVTSISVCTALTPTLLSFAVSFVNSWNVPPKPTFCFKK